MRFVTDDGEFGFIVTALEGRDMFRFQVVMEGVVLGDAEPAILGSAMLQFSSLVEVHDTRLSVDIDASDILTTLLADEELYDRVLLSSAESLDQWAVRGYRNRGNAVLVAQQYQNGELAGKVYSAILQEGQYQELIDIAQYYWNAMKNRI